MIGDPSGKTDMRSMLTKEDIENNIVKIKKQMESFIDFSDNKALMVNNADWLLNLNYVDFLRDIGIHFSVNNMLRAESIKQRLEKGLSFLEFNYMLMQGYDFLYLNQNHSCTMQLGGDDQWSNMLAGIDLVRRKERKTAYAMTCTLLTNSEGQKMGKTVNGALWLDAEKTPVYDFYQYWRNVDDKDVVKCLKLLTFVDIDEIERIESLEGENINEAKKLLAYEVTKLVHGEEEADKARSAAEALFGGGTDLSNVPTVEIVKADLDKSLLEILLAGGVFTSKAEGRRNMEQGGVSIDDAKITDISHKIKEEDFKDNYLLVKKGKKKIYRILITD
jgi:tyrosyl-tRNA synthetase